MQIHAGVFLGVEESSETVGEEVLHFKAKSEQQSVRNKKPVAI